MNLLVPFQDQTVEQLSTSFEHYVVIERDSVVKTVAILVVMEAKRGHLALGYTSLRQMCIRRFKLTRDQAKSRIALARLVKRCPQVLEALESGKLTMSAALLMRNHINAENVEELVTLGENKTKFEVEQIVASRDPKPPVEETLHKIPRSDTDVGAVAMPFANPGALAPLAPDLYKLIATVSETCRGYIEEARDLMRRKNPSGDFGVLAEAAFKLLVEHLRKEQFAETEQPREAKPSKDPTYIGNATKREVAERDSRQCSFVGIDGYRCTSRGWLEFDHIVPRARGGKGDTINVRLLCRAHNQYVAEQQLGPEHVAEKIAEARTARSAKRARAAETPAPAEKGGLEPTETATTTPGHDNTAATATPRHEKTATTPGHEKTAATQTPHPAKASGAAKTHDRSKAKEPRTSAGPNARKKLAKTKGKVVGTPSALPRGRRVAD